MNKIIAIIIVVLLIGAGAWYYTNNKSNNTVKDSASSQTEVQTEAQVTETSIKQLITEGKDSKCTFSISGQDNQGSGTGTFYITKNKSRGDIQATTQGAVSTSHIISDGDMGYFWIDESDLAYKIKIDEAATASSSSQAPIDPNSNYKFNCEPWTVDQSKFVLPNIEFKEFVMPKLPSTNDLKNMSPADICNSLPEPAKTQCLSSTKN